MMKANLLVRLLFFNNGLHKQQAVCIFILKIKRDAVKKKSRPCTALLGSGLQALTGLAGP